MKIQDEMKIVMLGTGTPNPIPERSGPCIAVIIGDSSYLVDAGPGLVRRAEMANRLGVEALEASQLKRLFLTHLHSDHTAGLPDVMLTSWVLERSEPLEVYGPKGTKSMCDHLLKAFELDIDARMNGLEQAIPEGIVVKAKDHPGEGLIYKDDKVKVEAFLVDHQPFEAYGYKFITDNKTIVISGDTIPSENLIKHAKGCDILVHEVYSAQGVKRRTPKWYKYHTSVHTSSIELGEIAKEVQPGKLVLYHQLFMNLPDEDGTQLTEHERELQMIREIKENYNGEVISAKDLDIIY